MSHSFLVAAILAGCVGTLANNEEHLRREVAPLAERDLSCPQTQITTHCFNPKCSTATAAGCGLVVQYAASSGEWRPLGYPTQIVQPYSPDQRAGTPAATSGTPSGRHGSITVGHGPKNPNASGSQVGDRLIIAGKLVPAPSPSGRINVGFVSYDGRVEFGEQWILKIDNGQPAVVSGYGDASVSVDGSFTLQIDKGRLGDHESWALVWFNPKNGDHADLQNSNGRRYEFQVADGVNEITLGPINFRR